ncbi:hypothetical protein FA15DRAFT_609201 [Coprinopsis marcescibilis]|uniref:Monopolin complex subunit Csm1/Pcs1 C-terminal domain-containing protein n=1 Tax=Coprinopsis marcescibilis TaxID=230819 RepID=A0A5C3LCD6_COPMA|nr:hypothetical protein FA15DRAFT_609201 [Coprinopsis marcescibilis]
MSSDSDDLGYTSLHKSTNPAKRKTTATGRSEVAGPSRKPKKSKANKRQKNAPADETDMEVEEIHIEELVESEEEEEVPAERPQGQSRTSKNTGGSGRPGNPSAQTKGKAKATAALKKRGRTAAEAVPVDDDNEVEETPMDIAAAYNKAANSKPVERETQKKASNINNKQLHKENTKLTRDNEKLKEEVKTLKAHFADFKTKYDELFNIRVTEAEALMHESEKQSQARIQAQDTIIENLHNQLAKKEPLLRATAGKKAVVSLLTRDEADTEVQQFKTQITDLKKQLAEAKSVVESKDREIDQLEETTKQIQTELNAEIKRSKDLADRARNHPPSVTRPGAGNSLGTDEPKAARVTRLYEDLTNILISSVKCSSSAIPGKEEWAYTCVYTHSDPTSPNSETSSLTFRLLFSWDNPDHETIHFQPLELDKESPEFIEKLGFLKNPFSFDRRQLSLLVKTLSETMSESDENNDSDEMEQ